MTLIISVINREYACTATDTQLTRRDGTIAEDSAMKSLKVDCTDASFMLSYTATDAMIKGSQIPDWLTMELSDFGTGGHSMDQILRHMKILLEAEYNATYGGFPNVPGVTIVAVGWITATRGLRPRLCVLTNCENADGSMRGASVAFDLYEPKLGKRATLHIRGALSTTRSKPFKKLALYAINLMKQGSSEVERNLVRSKLAELISIASQDPASNTIGSKVMASIITRKPTPLDFRPFPDSPNWSGPNTVNPTFSVRGLEVRGDFVEGGSFQLGDQWSPRNRQDAKTQE